MDKFELVKKYYDFDLTLIVHLTEQECEQFSFCSHGVIYMFRMQGSDNTCYRVDEKGC